MKNKDFFYLQYNKINWKGQEKTKINAFIDNYVIRNIILKHKGSDIAVFDIGFGIGFFFRTLIPALGKNYKNVTIEGCEPSRVNYNYFLKKKPKKSFSNVNFKTHNKTFQNTKTGTKFDFITSIYVFPHFLSTDLEWVVKKIFSMLKHRGKFILVLAEEKYLENKLKTEQDLFIETRNITYNGRQFKEWLHYSDIPEIGKIVDYNREEAYYLELFANNKFKLIEKKNINDSGFICTLFIFVKL